MIARARRPTPGCHRQLALAGLALSLLSLAPRAGAQAPSLRFDRITQEHGLSNGTVTSIVQDRTGFLWMGTEDGVNRYDGRHFTVFRAVRSDSATLSGSWVTRLALGRDDALWVATRQGLNRLDLRTERVRRYRHAPADSLSLSSNEVTAVHQGRDGAVWVGTRVGLDRLDPATGRVRRFAFPPHASGVGGLVLAIAEDGDGRVWAGTHAGLFRLDGASGRLAGVAAGPAMPVHTLLLDRGGRLWVGADSSLLVLDPARGAVLARFAPSDAHDASPFAGRVLALTEAPDGTLWIGSDGGLAAYDPRDGSWVRHAAEPENPRALAGSIVRSVFVDRGGVLWAGTESYGLARHAPSMVHFDLRRHEPGVPGTLSDDYVRGIREDRAGNVWIATQFGGLNRIERGTGRITVFRHDPADPRSLPGDNVWASLEDRAGVTWVGLSRRGLGTLDVRTGTFTPFAGVPSTASVNVLYEDRAGRLLVGLESIGLVEISADRRRTRRYGRVIGGAAGLATDDVQAILEDRQGMLWVGGDGGITRLDRATGTAIRFRAGQGAPGALAADFVTNIVEDSRGTLWVGTKGGGLNRLDRRTGRFTAIGTAQGLPHSFVYGILEDGRGHLWLSTDNGIARLDPRTGTVARFGLEDGLQALEFNRRAHYRSPTGAMYLGGVNGVNVFHPDDAAEPPPPPAVALLAITPAGGAPRRLAGAADSVVRLRHDERAFAVAFAALDYSPPNGTRYRYRLDGVDLDWSPASERAEATYASVPPGRYTFRVVAANGAGVWNPVGASLAIVVTPPWWGTWWARVLAALALVAVPAGAVRVRLRSVRVRSRWLEQRVEAQTRDLTAAQARLHDALEREREVARELYEITAAVPGAVFQLRELADGSQSLPFVSEGILSLCADGAGAQPLPADPLDAARWLFARLHADDLELADRSRAAARDVMGGWRCELRWRAAGDETRWLLVQAHPSSHEDGSVVWTGVVTDVTASQRAYAERAALEARVQQAQKAESLGVMAGGIAHDFNNLLVGVLANADLLREQLPLDEDGAETVAHIQSAARRAGELTQQLLAYAGRGRLVVERVALDALVREMLPLVRSAVPRTIAFELVAETPAPVVEADATQLRQVVMNLATNASEAIGDRPGRVRVRVGVRHATQAQLVLLHAAPEMPAEGPYAVLEVDDDGCGMDAALLGRIFDPFYSTKFTGRGLGLAALLGIVRAHRGGLHVVTAPGRGARFVVYLPLAGTAAAPLPPAEQRAAPRASAGCRVLVVDDDEAVRGAARRILRSLGHQVLVAGDGAAAIALLEQAAAVDLVLMDVTMPELDGPSTARALRARGHDVPIVLMSGYAAGELVARGVMTHADGFLKKPFTIPELAAVIAETAAVQRG